MSITANNEMFYGESEGEEGYTDEDDDNEGFAFGTVVIPVEKNKDFVDKEAVLINYIDGYVGKYLGQHLSAQYVKALKDDEEGDEGEDGAKDYWKVLGTFKDSKNAIPQFLWAVMRNEDSEAYLRELVKCSVIIYDVTEDCSQERLDEIRTVCDALRAGYKNFSTPRVFILISTLHSWSHSKLRVGEESFDESDYRRRRTRPLYRELQLLERYVVASGKMTKGMIRAYVIGAGAIYGEEESPLHHWFKCAWHNAKYLPIYGNGKNVVPTIYIKDLAVIIQNVMDKTPKKQRYILAVDPVLFQQDTIAKVISDCLGTGRVQLIPESDIYLNRDLMSFQADQLLLDLQIESTFCAENFDISAEAEDGFTSIIEKVSLEYRKARNLEPLKVIIVGPPGVGKSVVARQLSDLYRLNHFTKPDMIETTLMMMREIAGDPSELTIAGVDVGKEESLRETVKGLLSLVDEYTAESAPLPDDVFIKLVKFRLLSNHCKNQGWILDGFPENYDQAKFLFVKEGEGDDDELADEDEETAAVLDRRFVPDRVVILEASDDFIMQRLQGIPPALLEERHNETQFPQTILDYRERTGDYDNCFQFFMDENEVLYFPMDVSLDQSNMMQSTVFRISNMLGKPHNYGLSVDEEVALKNAQKFEQTVLEQREKEDVAQIESLELEERRKNIQLWMEKLAKVKREEFEREEASLIPLRHYLMAHVIPTLTRGLVEVTRARPEDPLDYLAEYLFQNNPGGINPVGENLLM